jgi:hypothetical protein
MHAPAKQMEGVNLIVNGPNGSFAMLGHESFFAPFACAYLPICVGGDAVKLLKPSKLHTISIVSIFASILIVYFTGIIMVWLFTLQGG